MSKICARGRVHNDTIIAPVGYIKIAYLIQSEPCRKVKGSPVRDSNVDIADSAVDLSFQHAASAGVISKEDISSRIHQETRRRHCRAEAHNTYYTCGRNLYDTEIGGVADK